MLSINTIDTLCISGGGNKCFTFLGSLHYLIKEHGFDMNNIKCYCGTSGGSLINFFFILGYTVTEVEEFLLTFNFFKCVDTNINLDNLLNKYGLDNGDKIIYVMKELLKNKFNVDDITMLDLYNLTKKEFIIIGTNYTRGIERVFTYKTTPNISVITALRISISIPFIFTPVIYEDEYYIDGGITNNFPINHCNQKTTLGLYVKGTIKNSINNITDIYFSCFNIMFDSSAEKVINNYDNIITIINTPEMFEKGFSNFDLDEEYKKYLLELGYSCAKLKYGKTNLNNDNLNNNLNNDKLNNDDFDNDKLNNDNFDNNNFDNDNLDANILDNDNLDNKNFDK